MNKYTLKNTIEKVPIKHSFNIKNNNNASKRTTSFISKSSTTNNIHSSTLPTISGNRRSRSSSSPPKHISSINKRSSRHIQYISPNNHDFSNSSNSYSPPLHILYNRTDNETFSTTKLQSSPLTHSRGRNRSRSLSNHRNRCRRMNFHSSPKRRSISPIDISYLNNNNSDINKQQSNLKTRSRTSWLNPNSRPNSHISRFNSNYGSTRTPSTSQLHPPSYSLSVFPSLHQSSSSEQHATNTKDPPNIDSQQIITAKSLDPPLPQSFSTTTIKCMRDNNIANKTDTVQLNNNPDIQNLVPSRTRHFFISCSTKFTLLSTSNHISSQTSYKIHHNTTIHTSRPPIKHNILNFHRVDNTNSIILSK